MFKLDGIYSRVMRDGKRQDICWTDLVWEELIAEIRKHDEPWLIRMIGILNNVASDIKREYPHARLEQVKFPEGKKATKRWLRNSLIFLTAELRLVSDEMRETQAVKSKAVGIQIKRHGEIGQTPKGDDNDKS